MRKRYMLSGILGLSAFLYSSNLMAVQASSDDAHLKKSAITFAKPQKKPTAALPSQQEELQQSENSSELELPVREVKKKSAKQSVAIVTEEDSIKQAPQEPVAAPVKRNRQQPIGAPAAAPVEAAAKPSEQEPIAAPVELVAKPSVQEPVAAPVAPVAKPAVQAPVASQQSKKVKKAAQSPQAVKRVPAKKAQVHPQVAATKKVAMVKKEMPEPSKSGSSTVPAQAQVITTPTAPIVNDNDNLFFGLEYLIMTTSEGGLSYAVQNTPNVNHCYDADFDWNSGFRLGVGYNMGHDRWDLQMVWTWLLTRGHHTKTDSVNQLYSTNAAAAIDPLEGVLANTFQSHVNLHLNLLDTKMGREFFVSKWLTLHPSAGIRVGWVNQAWNTKATGDITALGSSLLTEYKIDMKQKFWGIGPMVGLDTEWGLISNFNLYANGSVALLTGFFNDYRNDTAVQTGKADITNPFRRRSHQPQWVSELALGLRWNQWMGGDRYRLVLQAGWDAIFFNDHNHLFSMTGNNTNQMIESNGDLMSQGVSMGVRLDF